MSVGGIGVTGTQVANTLLRKADLIFAIGTRLGDFTTMSKLNFGETQQTEILALNVSPFDGYKMGATLLHADAKNGLEAIKAQLKKEKHKATAEYQTEIKNLRSQWNAEVDKLYHATSHNGTCQTAVLGAINNFIAKDDVIICAAGSLPGDLHKLWRCKQPKSYHLEYAFSCMGYEVAAGLGVKLAKPDGETYVIVGDGSYIMLHSELLTSIQEQKKINIILLNNHGYQCIKNLQMSQGAEHFGNEFRYRDKSSKKLDGKYLQIDFAKYAEALGAKTFKAKNIEQLKTALQNAKKETSSTLIEIEVEPGTMSDGYDSWWRVGVAETSNKEKINSAYKKCNWLYLKQEIINKH